MAISLANRRTLPKGRVATREFRRQQLIESTIESIAKRGFSETTMADVADGAGLSRGIVNFHFTSKDQLLVETLQFLADEYREAWRRALAKAGPKPIDRLQAMFLADLDPQVCNRKKIAVWYAFYGEAKSRPTYLKLCAERDREQNDIMIDLARQVIDEGAYKLEAETIVNGLSALTDGLWLDQLIWHKTFEREAARQTVLTFLSACFPKHYGKTTPVP